MRLDITMLVKNRGWILPYVLRCLQRLEIDQTRTRVLFIDDASGDNSLALLRRWKRGPGRKFLAVELDARREGLDDAMSARATTDRRHGYPHLAQLRNDALDWVRAGDATHQLAWDSDILVSPRLVEVLATPSQPMVGALIFNDGQSPALGWTGRSIPNAGGWYGHKWLPMRKYELGQRYPAGYTGALALLRRDALESGARYGVWVQSDQRCEDYAFCWGLQEAGLDRWLDTTPAAIHVMEPGYLVAGLRLYAETFGTVCTEEA